VSDTVPPLAAIAPIFSVIPDLATPEQVQESMRLILGDPTFELFWWDWEHERYVDVRGEPASPEERAGRAVTRVEYESRKVGALEHDPQLLEHPEFLGAIVPAMRIAMERDRLHRDLIEKLDELKASRLRIIEAADEERSRLQRNLHDGAQQRLIVALLGLRGLERRLHENAGLIGLVRAAREELEGAIEDLRELARGLHPPLLAQHGLAAAVRAGADRSALPVELDLRLDADLPPSLEAAAYYVCAEAVTNAVKHAQATRVWLSIVHEDATLTVEIRDDGVGGAMAGRGGESTGLRGLRDRVEALEGRLTVQSPPGHGTRLLATFPVRPAVLPDI
jgi:signal transduction histidine kinase